MNRLQSLPTAKPQLVTLNATDRIDPDEVVARMTYEHPIYTAGRGGRPGGLAGAEPGRPGLRRRLPRLGLSRGRVPFG